MNNPDKKKVLPTFYVLRKTRFSVQFFFFNFFTKTDYRGCNYTLILLLCIPYYKHPYH